MKNKFLPLFTTAIMGAIVTQAQITVTSNDFKPRVSPNQSHAYDFDTTNLVLPTSGANQVWDYSTLTPTDSSSFSLTVSNKQAPFTNSDFMEEDGGLLFGNFLVDDVTNHASQNNDAFKIDGYVVGEQFFDLAAPTDTLILLEQNIVTSGLNPGIRFDLTDNASFNDEAIDTIRFELTYQTLSMNRAPGYLIRTTQTATDVLGWGSVILPVTKDTIEALYVQVSRKNIDSVYINNSPAPAAMLTNTGLSQGVETEYFSHFLIGKGYDQPLAEFGIEDDNATLYGATFINMGKYGEDTTTAINRIQTTAINAYPNPTHDVLNIDLNTSEKIYAEIFSINGRMLGTQTVTNKQLSVANLQTGSYVVLIKNDAKETLGMIKFIKE
jgi:hypothetical protein